MEKREQDNSTTNRSSAFIHIVVEAKDLGTNLVPRAFPLEIGRRKPWERGCLGTKWSHVKLLW